MSAARRRKAPARPAPLRCTGCGAVLTPWATEEQAAAYTQRSTQHLRNLRSTGGGPPYQQVEAGGTVTYAYSDLDAWLRKHTRYSTSDVPTEGRGASAPH